MRDAVSAFRVVVVTGPRQSGKTTLVRHVLGPGGTLVRLDDEATLQAARTDPATLARTGATPRAFDEIQRAGDPLVRAIKAVVDENPAPGQFLLDGSADFLTVPTISESLAGRAAFFELWPFTQGELGGGPDRFVDVAFTDPDRLRDGPTGRFTPADYLERVVTGGFPEATMLEPRTRRTWFTNYIRTVTQRDITELTGARRAEQLPRLLRLIAARTANELIPAHLHADAGLGSRVTTDDYIGFLIMAYLVELVPAWSKNLTTKVKRHAKVHICDSGLAAFLLGKQIDALARPTDPARGPLLETFATNELRRQLAWSEVDPTLHHFRDRDGAEVDVILEAADGRVLGIEVKASATVDTHDFRWLRLLRTKLGDDLVHGFVLYCGDRPLAFGDRLTAIPLSYVWEAE
ncbi:MAG TPA: ATP-binding protein [Acidimicrobiia bacterium]|nr:ATP-binding protein [Acidimicrobiia bacterium]